MRYITLAIFISNILSSLTALSQTPKDSSGTGVVKGTLKDSAHNYVLPDATIAIYNAKDSTLISFQLTNSLGQFYFKEIPAETPLKLIASYVGYKSTLKLFTIPIGRNEINLNFINIDRAVEYLDEVIVMSVPPVRMNGDTLEFNADAFKLDKNAVGEDLLKRLPGVIVWGDGKITVNGKDIAQVLVNGKPFFGGNAKIATQNISKDAIDKVQVYQQNINPNNPLDSTTEINLKLKKGKSNGYFGKFAFGYGLNKRYEGDASINFFNTTTQVGLVGATNNTNKIANNVSTLMENSTFKGIGASVDYQPNFRTPGINQTNSAGALFQKDFILNPDKYKINRLNANYFLKNYVNDTRTDILTTTALGENNTQIASVGSSKRITGTKHNLQAQYEKNKDNFNYKINTEFGADNNNSDASITTDSRNLSSRQSTSTLFNNTAIDAKKLTVQANFNHTKENRFSSSPGDWSIKYTGNIEETNNKITSILDLTSFVNTVNGTYIDRIYENNSNSIKNSLQAKIGNLYESIFGRRSSLSAVNIEIENQLSYSTDKNNSFVVDKDTTSGTYIKNSYLTNNSTLSILDEKPAINFTKNFHAALANRYEKTVVIALSLRQQFYSQKNISDHQFQNFNQTYSNFVPDFAFNYTNYQFGAFQSSTGLTYASTYIYPTTGMLAPLIDSSNIYYLRIGNILLKPSNRNEGNLRFQHKSFRTKNTFNYSINVGAGVIDNYHADSTIIDSAGRSAIYTVNINGYKYVLASINLNKAFKFKNHQVQVNLDTKINWAKTPGYIRNFTMKESNLNVSNNTNFGNSLIIFYTFRDILALNITHGLNLYYSDQTALARSRFRNSIQNIGFSASANCTRKLSISSNISYNHATLNGLSPVDYTIWNANIAYRFLEGNNLELKMSALDLLAQNTNIVNYGSGFSITRGTTDVLKQYFMLTLSYFPRSFGKK